MSTDQPWPRQLTYSRAARALRVEFDDGATFTLPAEYLRVESPSAEVQGHGAATRILVSGKRNVSVSAIEPVGQYAVRIVFDDGHDTGLYAWSYLHQLGLEHDRRWAEYESRLAAAGRGRDT